MWDMQNDFIFENNKNKIYETIAKELLFENTEEMINLKKDLRLTKAIELICRLYGVPNLLKEKETKENKIENNFSTREFNYYFEKNSIVTIDKEMLIYYTNPKYINFAGKRGVVKNVTTDLHSFAQGSSYMMTIEFDGEVLENVFAPYVIEYVEKK